MVAAATVPGLPDPVLEELYRTSRGRPYWLSLLAMMKEGPLGLVLLGGEGAVPAWRACMGANCGGANVAAEHPECGHGQYTVRGAVARDATYNAVHGSDSVEEVLRETGLVAGLLRID